MTTSPLCVPLAPKSDGPNTPIPQEVLCQKIEARCARRMSYFLLDCWVVAAPLNICWLRPGWGHSGRRARGGSQAKARYCEHNRTARLLRNKLWDKTRKFLQFVLFLGVTFLCPCLLPPRYSPHVSRSSLDLFICLLLCLALSFSPKLIRKLFARSLWLCLPPRCAASLLAPPPSCWQPTLLCCWI